MITNVNDFHRTISNDAAMLANQDPEKPAEFFFRPRSQDSRKTVQGVEGIKLEWDPEGRLNDLEPERREETIALMRRIAMRAVKRSLVENGDLLVGVILGDARQGRAYTDVFGAS